MQYRLLRSNKESGPYTKAQLEEMGLKPYDLLWLEGRGGAWLYASEIEDLKSIAPAIEEQPYDRFYKGKEKQSATANNSKQTTSFNNSNTTTASTATATLKPPKPRIRITGDKVVMIDNAALQQPQPITNIISSFPKEQPTAIAPKPAVKQEPAKPAQTVGLEWEDMYSDWKGEEKPAEEKTATPAKVQTMEEVRQRFEEAKLKQLDEKQNKTTSTARQNIMAGIAVLVLAIGGYAGYKLNSGSDATRSTQSAPAVEKAEVVQDKKNGQQNTGDVPDANTATQQPSQTVGNTNDASANEIKNTLNDESTKPVNTAPAPVENKNATDIKKDQATPEKNTSTNTPVKIDQKTTLKQTPITNKDKVANSVSADNNTAIASNKKADNTQYDINKPTVTAPIQAPVTQPAVVKQQEAPAKKISDYIAVSKLGGNANSGSVQNVLLSVKNVSDFPIDLAVIDIQYYGANGRFQKGETMYVKNIGAGNNVNVRIPDGKTAHSISYKVSLVSSEQKTLYLVGD